MLCAWPNSREGELVAVYNERDEVHRLHHDSAGRCIAEETFDGRTLRYKRDAAGRIVRMENGAREVTTVLYDAAGQIVSRTQPDESSETFEYNVRGELVRASNAHGDFHFERNPLGRVVREVQNVDGDEQWIELEYDGSGNRTARKTLLGHAATIKRDAMGARLSTLLDGENRIEHATDLLGREVRRRLPSGVTIESAFDPMGHLAQRIVRRSAAALPASAGQPEWMGHRDDGFMALTSYQRDADGEIVAKHDRGRGSTGYEYDPIGQLLAAAPEQAPAEVFRYDPAGNVYEASPAHSEREYTKGNRLLRKGTSEYEWDDEGRLSRKIEHLAGGRRVWRYAWNGAGLLRSVETPDGTLVDFTYDPFARRVSKRVLQREGLEWKTLRRTRFVWDGGRASNTSGRTRPAGHGTGSGVTTRILMLLPAQTQLRGRPCASVSAIDS
jgi:YD repeat-containing protein